MIEKVINYINKHNLVVPNSTIIVGLSGGTDSVCLLHVLSSISNIYNITLIAAHLNHNWRSKEETDIDLKICVNLCDMLNIKLITKSLESTEHIKSSGSKEADARTCRRDFFQSLLKEFAASAIALAHHQDDQVETFFIRLIRGANISGLSCIKPKSGNYIRPLLDVSKEEIYKYLNLHNLDYAVDKTNADNSFLRNNIRNNILPIINKADARFLPNCLKAIDACSQVDLFISRLISNFLDNNTITEDATLWLNINALENQDEYLHAGIILAWLIRSNAIINSYLSSRYLQEIIKFISSKSLKHQVHPNLLLIKNKNGEDLYLGVRATD